MGAQVYLPSLVQSTLISRSVDSENSRLDYFLNKEVSHVFNLSISKII